MLYNNYPNPFNPSTTLRFDLPENSKVSLVVYNLLGESIRTIVNNIDYKPGRFSVEWDGRDNSGFTVPSGVYLIRFETEKYREVKKAILLK
ncbi:MAG: T9SS type A sorting domain-containing protein [Ignavibacteriales bacterium]|nr:T9SS type A sorting domain-containing protein [Ignavibacteriales bacterium]